jgi:hypothetical protein
VFINTFHAGVWINWRVDKNVYSPSKKKKTQLDQSTEIVSEREKPAGEWVCIFTRQA